MRRPSKRACAYIVALLDGRERNEEMDGWTLCHLHTMSVGLADSANWQRAEAPKTSDKSVTVIEIGEGNFHVRVRGSRATHKRQMRENYI